jgi:hypothetical protein
MFLLVHLHSYKRSDCSAVQEGQITQGNFFRMSAEENHLNTALGRSKSTTDFPKLGMGPK